MFFGPFLGQETPHLICVDFALRKKYLELVLGLQIHLFVRNYKSN